MVIEKTLQIEDIILKEHVVQADIVNRKGENKTNCQLVARMNFSAIEIYYNCIQKCFFIYTKLAFKQNIKTLNLNRIRKIKPNEIRKLNNN